MKEDILTKKLFSDDDISKIFDKFNFEKKKVKIIKKKFKKPKKEE